MENNLIFAALEKWFSWEQSNKDLLVSIENAHILALLI